MRSAELFDSDRNRPRYVSIYVFRAQPEIAVLEAGYGLDPSYGYTLAFTGVSLVS